MVEQVEQAKVKVAKGTRDMLPEQMEVREYVFGVIKECYRRHGAVQIDTPIFELRSTLFGKYGEANKLVYDLEDQGGEKLSLRYDLTVPFARYMATNNFSELKRYHIGKVYRRDQPNIRSGRYREFYQCDFDIAYNSDPMVADAEVLKVFSSILAGFKLNFVIKINDRRLLDLAIITRAGCDASLYNTVCSSIDKLDKEPWEKIEGELKGKGLNADQIKSIQEFIEINGPYQEVIAKLEGLFGNQTVIDEVKLLYKYLDAMNATPHIKFEPSLARGLDYYTGMIFEAVLAGEDSSLGLGSIAGGGRYDNLIGMFSREKIPATGGSIGIERIFNILEEKAKAEKGVVSTCDVMIGEIGTVDTIETMKVANWLWDNCKLRTEITYKKMNIKELLPYALKRGASYMVFLSEKELAEGKLLVKNLSTKTQIEIDYNQEKLLEALNQK